MALASPCAGLSALHPLDLKCQPTVRFGAGLPDSALPSPLQPFQEATLHPLSSRALPLHFQTDVFLLLVMAETLDPKAS